MTYTSDESSQEGGNPVELYEFVGTTTTYRYTSSDANITFDGNVYTALPITRKGISTPPDGGSPEFVLTLPVNSAVSADYVFSIAPPDLLLTVYRVHGPSYLLVNSITLWTGEVAGFSVKGHTVSVRVPSPLAQRMEDKIPSVHYQRLCNNVLFDSVCTATRASYLVTTTINSISSDGTVITVTSMAPEVSNWALGGEIVKTSTGERRMILDHTGNDLQILWPFSSNVVATDAVEVTAGCDHSMDNCVNKFANEDNFTGMPFVVTQDLSFNAKDQS